MLPYYVQADYLSDRIKAPRKRMNTVLILGSIAAISVSLIAMVSLSYHGNGHPDGYGSHVLDKALSHCKWLRVMKVLMGAQKTMAVGMAYSAISPDRSSFLFSVRLVFFLLGGRFTRLASSPVPPLPPPLFGSHSSSAGWLRR